MREYTTVEVEDIVRTEMKSDMESLLREGARRMLEVALKVEVAEYVNEHLEELDEDGKRKVVRRLPSRSGVGHRRG